ncbi:S-layer homology domain-containing protein, partial [Agathobaculum desmolans]|uniref:S-layer homology domain-containing protein n=1 Tax=Agathobaculum desmolans TaxID=39484 RepID=UPI0039B946EC
MFAGAAFTDEADFNVNADTVDTLVALGVIDGYADGSFKPEGTVSRAEMAKMIYVARTGSDNADSYRSLVLSINRIINSFQIVVYINEQDFNLLVGIQLVHHVRNVLAVAVLGSRANLAAVNALGVLGVNVNDRCIVSQLVCEVINGILISLDHVDVLAIRISGNRSGRQSRLVDILNGRAVAYVVGDEVALGSVEVRGLDADGLLTVGSPQGVLYVVGAAFLDQVRISGYVTVSGITGSFRNITRIDSQRANLRVLEAVGLRVHHNAVGSGEVNGVLAPSVYNRAGNNLGIVVAFNKDHRIVRDLGSAVFRQLQGLVSVRSNGVVALEARLVGSGDGLDLVLAAVHGKGKYLVSDLRLQTVFVNRRRSIAEVTTCGIIDLAFALFSSAASDQLNAIDLGDQRFLGGTIGEVQLGVQVGVQTSLNFNAVHMQNVRRSSRGVGDFYVKRILANGDYVNLIANIEGLTRYQRGIPVAVNHAFRTAVAGTGNFAGHNRSLYCMVVAVNGVASHVNNSPVIFRNAVICNDVLNILVADGIKAGNGLEGHRGVANIGNLGNNKRGNERGINLAVVVVVDQLNAVSLLQAAVGSRQISQLAGRGAVIEAINLCVVIDLVLGAVQLDLVRAAVNRIQIADNAGCYNFGIRIRIYAVNIIGILVQNLNILAHQFGVILVDLGE